MWRASGLASSSQTWTLTLKKKEAKTGAILHDRMKKLKCDIGRLSECRSSRLSSIEMAT